MDDACRECRRDGETANTIGNAADGCAGLVAECGEGGRGCGYSIYVECRFHIYIK